MIYAGIDVNIITHEKVLDACQAGLDAFGLWAWGMCYAQLHETNGRLPRVAVLTALGGRRNIMLAQRLVASGLWQLNEDGSWQVFNYDRKNQTAEEIRDKKAKAAERVRAWRERKLGGSGNAPVTRYETRNERVRTDPSPEPDNTTRKQNSIGTEPAAPAPPPAPSSRRVMEPVVEQITPLPSRRKPETPCPPSDAEPGAVRGWADRWKLPVDHAEFAHFLDHHRKSDARWRDWTAAWRTWLKNASRFRPRQYASQIVQSGDNRAWKLPEGFE